MTADDLGWDDVSFHGNQQIPTPNLDALAKSGITLEKNYVQPACSPTRASLLTGRHVINTGVYSVLHAHDVLSSNFTLLPQFLSDLGYSCHAIGKWHLGRTSWPFTPLSRGFESFYGFLGGELDHYYHGNEDSFELDFWANQDPDFENICWDGNLCPDSAYTDTINADYAIERIKSVGEEEEAQPLFLYLSWHNPHEPLEAPKNVVDSFTDTVENSRRRVYAAMVQELDNNVGRVLTALDDAGIRNNTFIVFTSDNGGFVHFLNGNDGLGSNWPLRGSKGTLLEGGVRVPALVAGVGISEQRVGTSLNGLLHATDWLKTLLSMVAKGSGLGDSWEDVISFGDNEESFNFADGVDQWDYLSGASDESPRSELLLEAHGHGSADGYGNALIMGDYKIILRSGAEWSSNNDLNDGWYGGTNGTYGEQGAYALPTGYDTQPYTIQCANPPASVTDGFVCETVVPGSEESGQKGYACLFNLADDPCEFVDVSATEPDVLNTMFDRLKEYRQVAADAAKAVRSPDGSHCPVVLVKTGCSFPGDAGDMKCQYTSPC